MIAFYCKDRLADMIFIWIHWRAYLLWDCPVEYMIYRIMKEITSLVRSQKEFIDGIKVHVFFIMNKFHASDT